MPAKPLARFGAVASARPVALGEGCLLVAAHLGDHPDIGEGLARLAAIADGVDGNDLDAVARHLFGTLGFGGNRTAYYDPANSLLPDVLRRRTGIPITLAALVIDVARRRGIPAVGVGMPGHFLVGDGPRPTRWLDAFDGGTWLDEAGAEARFTAVHGSAARFQRQFLQPTPDALVLARVLANLAGIYRSTGEANRLVRVLELRDVIPAANRGTRAQVELAEALASVGRVGEAADHFDAVADRLDPEQAPAARERAQVLRASLN